MNVVKQKERNTLNIGCWKTRDTTWTRHVDRRRRGHKKKTARSSDERTLNEHWTLNVHPWTIVHEHCSRTRFPQLHFYCSSSWTNCSSFVRLNRCSWTIFTNTDFGFGRSLFMVVHTSFAQEMFVRGVNISA